jgi:hypothetical protein
MGAPERPTSPIHPGVRFSLDVVARTRDNRKPEQTTHRPPGVVVIALERAWERALGVRQSASAVTSDRRGPLLPTTLLPNHRVRIRDATARLAAAFIR